ncbi:hypothetical protein TEQG_00175 [Trichophyton equinum CBS 127.97]|uniref:NADH-ubiquinone oxidoreductase 178 kDa subunit n=2 Tax=Trichophyton TaxID=5550 RepID=F2PGV3_TRIEC|nr:hypothetical protein TEQG_00175 [Trichophyton equinum CBS 127.97]
MPTRREQAIPLSRWPFSVRESRDGCVSRAVDCSSIEAQTTTNRLSPCQLCVQQPHLELSPRFFHAHDRQSGPRGEDERLLASIVCIMRHIPRCPAREGFCSSSSSWIVTCQYLNLTREKHSSEQQKGPGRGAFSRHRRPGLLSLQLKASVMFLARRATAPARRALVQRQPRRFDSHSAHHEPVNEHLGRGFYIAVASIPVGLALYKYSTSDASSKPWLTRVIETFTASEAVLERNNALHTRAIEEAAADRHLFHSQNPPLTIDMSFPELFNTGSPINMSPGRSSGDLSAVVAHYEKRQADMEKARVGRMKDGKVQSLYEDGRYF